MDQKRAIAYIAGVVTGLAISVSAVGGVMWAQATPGQVGASELGSRFGVTVVYYEDRSPCGSVTEHGGCWRPVEPDTIYVQAGLEPDIERSLILHEIAHALQYRAGVPRDECAADAIAVNLGATWTGYDC